MAVEEFDKEDTEEEYEEAEVDYREELVTSIEVIRRENRKNKKLQAELAEQEEGRHSRTREYRHGIEGSNRII
jgi:hypothetical protein